jgi:hypothetical protein
MTRPAAIGGPAEKAKLSGMNGNDTSTLAPQIRLWPLKHLRWLCRADAAHLITFQARENSAF